MVVISAVAFTDALARAEEKEKEPLEQSLNWVARASGR
jgi:hypothetical protein